MRNFLTKCPRCGRYYLEEKECKECKSETINPIPPKVSFEKEKRKILLFIEKQDEKDLLKLFNEKIWK